MAKRVKKGLKVQIEKLIKEIEYRQEQLAELIAEKARHRPAEDRRRRRRKKKKKKKGGGSKTPKKKRRKT